jgi:hypothetical protein
VEAGRSPARKQYDEVVRFVLFLWLPLAAYRCNADEQLQLQKEDVRAIQRVLRKTDSSLDWFHIIAKKRVDNAYSVMVIRAAPSELRSGSRRSPVGSLMRIGVFVVSGTENEVRLVLDTYPLPNVFADPALDQPTEHSVCLHLYSDYGMYHGSIKYIYDLLRLTLVVKVRYGILALTSSMRENGKLHYMASFGGASQLQEGWTERHAIITIEPRVEDSLPRFQIVDTPSHEDLYTEPTPLSAVAGESVIIANKTPPGKEHQASRIYVVSKSGTKNLFSPPVPSALFRK